jgi:APA family basic amino acid/polyamine antiporter
MAAALVVAASTVSLGFGRYLREFVTVDERMTAAVLILVMAYVSYLGMERAAWMIVGLASIEVGSLLVVAALGVPSIGDHDLLSGSVSGVLSAAGLVFFAFIGFDEVITLAEETRDPSKTVPRALLAALGISTVLYVAVAIAAVSVLGVSGVVNAERPLAQVGQVVVGGWAGDALSIAALVSTGTTVLLVITAASRMFYGMARVADFPKVLADVRHRRVPLNALVLTVLVALIFLLLGNLKTLAAATDALIYLIFLLVNIVVIVLRFTKPQLPRPFRIRGSIGRLPLVPVGAFVVVLVVARELQRDSLWMVVAVLVVGLVAHLVSRRPRLAV